MPGCRFERVVEAQVQVAVRVEALDPLDVGHRHLGAEVIAVGRRKGVAVAPV
jgi:hypothetical protein